MQAIEARLGEPVAGWLTREYAAGRSMTELGAEIGVDKATLSRWFRQFGIAPRYHGYRGRKS